MYAVRQTRHQSRCPGYSMTSDQTTTDRGRRLAGQLREALDKVAASRPFAKTLHQGHVFDLTVRLLREPGGAAAIYPMSPDLESAGVFHGSDWDTPDRLQPALAGGSLRGEAVSVAVEALSDLRMLAIAKGLIPTHATVTPQQAREFLEELVARNLDLLQPVGGEAERGRSRGLREAASALLRFIVAELGSEGVLQTVVSEIERVLEQRPILINRTLRMVDSVREILEHTGATEPRAQALIDAVDGPTALSKGADTSADYGDMLIGLDAAALLEEARLMGQSMYRTGLVCAYHSMLLREAVRRQDPELVCVGLALGRVGYDSMDAYRELCMRLIELAITPSTAQAGLGMSMMLERGILFFPPVAPGLWRLTGLQLDEHVAALLDRGPGGDTTVPPLHRLLAGTLCVLGQPLGVGQGDNPTCQSARAISLWAQSDPGYLLELITWAARDNEVDMHFEGALLQSTQLGSGLVEELHTELDSVSLVLVPHLDRIYIEMGRRIAGREEDGHRWINPEFHGWWVHRSFATTIQYSTGAVIDFSGFIRLFYSAYHPAYNGGRTLIYPQPAGIAATSAEGVFLGWHAVAIQRVTIDPHGEIRVYFYNPNNEGRQDWGQGIHTSTSGCGEAPGESSLPFESFASRIYVFHYNFREIGDRALVPADALERVTRLARESWGADRAWHDVVPV